MARKMTTTACKILDALSTQTDLIAQKEHMSVDPDILSVLGRAVGQQVRVVRLAAQFGLFTITSSRQEKKNTDMRMDDVARERLGTTATFSGTCNSECVKNSLSDAELQAQGEYGERLSGSGSGLVVLSPHGGMIENYTDEEAERVLSQLEALSKPVQAWRGKGWGSGDQGAYARWHIGSEELHGASYPLLGQLDAGPKFTYAVSFHGYSLEDIAVGGGAPLALKQEVANAIQAVVGSDYEVTVVESGPYAGVHPNNIVNRLTTGGVGGVQIEQPSGARSAYWVQIADAVAAVFASKI